MDEIDQAQQNDEFYRREALREHYRRRTDTTQSEEAKAGPAPRRGAGSGGGELLDHLCIDCGGEIPPERRAAQPGAERCLGCQIKHEGRSRR